MINNLIILFVFFIATPCYADNMVQDCQRVREYNRQQFRLKHAQQLSTIENKIDRVLLSGWDYKGEIPGVLEKEIYDYYNTKGFTVYSYKEYTDISNSKDEYRFQVEITIPSGDGNDT